MKARVLIIIPAYNEEESILDTVHKIKKYNTDLDVIVINDGSKDNTETICKNNDIPYITLIHNLGIGGAVQTGYKYAMKNNYDIAVQFDGDGQHEIESLEEMLNPIMSGEADFVIGSRFVKESKSTFKSSFSRRMGIKLISHTIKIVTGKKVYDVTSGYRACNRQIIEDFAISYPVEYPEPITNTELLKKKKRVLEVPALMYERQGGKSSIRSWKNIYYMVNILLSICIIGTRRWK
jgi:Glycosyltransferases involved in cell wall biogenesis